MLGKYFLTVCTQLPHCALLTIGNHKHVVILTIWMRKIEKICLKTFKNCSEVWMSFNFTFVQNYFDTHIYIGNCQNYSCCHFTPSWAFEKPHRTNTYHSLLLYYVRKYVPIPILYILACRPAYGQHMLSCQSPAQEPVVPTQALRTYPENFVTYIQTLRLSYIDVYIWHIIKVLVTTTPTGYIIQYYNFLYWIK